MYMEEKGGGAHTGGRGLKGKRGDASGRVWGRMRRRVGGGLPVSDYCLEDAHEDVRGQGPLVGLVKQDDLRK